MARDQPGLLARRGSGGAFLDARPPMEPPYPIGGFANTSAPGPGTRRRVRMMDGWDTNRLSIARTAGERRLPGTTCFIDKHSPHESRRR